MKIEKATLTKSELRKMLGIGYDRLEELIKCNDFPKAKEVIGKWSRESVERWLNNESLLIKTESSQHDYVKHFLDI